MTEKDLIDIADSNYFDGLVGECYRDVEAFTGDRLVPFIVAELKGLDEAYPTDDERLEEAEQRMVRAAEELFDVAEGFARRRRELNA